MQNHGPYDYSEAEAPYYKINTMNGSYENAEQYLGLIHETDKAIEYLITYFEDVDDDVVIVFFGDHFPNLDQTFYEELYGKSFETLDEKLMQYTIPFFVWANYPIESKYIPLTSINFLSNYLFEAAGIEMPPYNQFLADVERVIPALNSKGYYSDANSCFIEFEEAKGAEKKMLDEYQILQYNSIFDKKNRSAFFE